MVQNRKLDVPEKKKEIPDSEKKSDVDNGKPLLDNCGADRKEAQTEGAKAEEGTVAEAKLDKINERSKDEDVREVQKQEGTTSVSDK